MMNIVRTTAVELSTIPAIAYKQKLAAGGAGIKIFRLDQNAVAVLTINNGDGSMVAYKPYDNKLFPDNAVNEALELTLGLPYSARGKLNIIGQNVNKEEEDVGESETDKIDMVGSDEYKAIIAQYMDNRGKLNYTLMNKDFIQFAAKSTTVANMVAEKMQPKDIVAFIVQSRSAFIVNKKESISIEQAHALIETLDEIDPRSAFKELTAHIKRMLAQK